MQGLVAAPGGFWASFQPDIDTVGIGRFDPRGAMVASSTFALPAALYVPSRGRHGVVDLLDTSVAGQPPELTLLMYAESDANFVEDQMVFVRIDGQTLRPILEIAMTGAPGDFVTDGDLLLVSDDNVDAVRVFRYPLSDPPVEEAMFGVANSVGVGMGPILAASDRRVWMVGRRDPAAGLDVYGARDAHRALVQSAFVRAPDAVADALVRVGPTRALGFFLEPSQMAGGPVFLWATLLDFSNPSQVVPGISAVVIGNDAAFQVRTDSDGVAWVVLANEGKILGLRVP